MRTIKNYNDFVNEGLTTKDAKDTIKDIFNKFEGEVKDEYLKKMWDEDSTLRELYGKKDFDKAWDELVEDGTIETDDGKKWCWCKSKKKEAVEESVETEEESVLESSHEEFMDRFGIDEKGAKVIDKAVNKILGMNDLDDRMDYVDQLDFWAECGEDDNKSDEVIEFIKDTYVI